jgi:ribosomal protein S12 methylthiotransferase
MELQQVISLEKNQAFVGRIMDVLVEGQGGPDDKDVTSGEKNTISVGRTYRDAPEIDGLVVVDGKIPIGEMIPIRITGAMPYDLSGEVAT